MAWQKLVDTALLGTDRGRITTELRKELEGLLGFPLDDDPAEALLQGSGLIAFLRKTSRPVGRTENPSERAGPPADERPQAGTSLARRLRTLAAGRFQPFLPEAVGFLLREGVALPPDILPTLWDKALTDPDLHALFFDRLPPPEAWLARQHPRWYALAPLPWDPFLNPDRDSRYAALRALRRRGEEVVPRLSDWADLSPEDKVFFLQAFRGPLRSEEVSFLEDCLEDPRKEVRHRAARLLIREPASSLSGDWSEDVQRTLVLEEGRLVYRGSAGLESPWKRLGLWHAKPIDQVDLMARHSPVAGWADWYGRPLSEWLPVVWESRFGKAWMRGFVRATLEQGVSVAARELLLFGGGQSLDLSASQSRGLIDCLGQEDFLGLLAGEVQKKRGLLPEQSLAFQLLLHGRHPWPSGLARSVLGPFQEWLSTAKTVNWGAWHYRKLLQVAAYRLSPGDLRIWENGWPDYGYIWEQWKEAIGHFRRILEFRQRFYEAVKALKA